MTLLTNPFLPEIIRTDPPDTLDDFRETCPVCGAKIQPDKLSAHILATHTDKPSSLRPQSAQRDGSSQALEMINKPIRRSNSKSSPVKQPQPIIQVKPRKKTLLTDN